MTFLKHRRAGLNVIDTWAIGLPAIVGKHPARDKVRRTQFLNIGEGFLFSELIHQAFTMPEAAAVETIIDLGTGSALPSLRAVWEQNVRGRHLDLIGIDIDPDAIAIASANAKTLGVESHASFVQQDMALFLRSYTQKRGQIIVSNPPYIPVPDAVQDSFFTPIHAGPDGLKYVRPILEHPWNHGTFLCLFASSLSSPASLMKAIEEKYDILHIIGHLVPFGVYISDPRILPYLEQMKEAGQCTFGVSAEGKRCFVSLGFVLQRK